MTTISMERYVSHYRRYTYENSSSHRYSRKSDPKSNSNAPFYTIGTVLYVLHEDRWLEAVVIREIQDHLFIHYVGAGKGGWMNRFSRRLTLSPNQTVWAGYLRGVQWTLPEDVPAIRRLLKLGCDINLRSANPITNPLCVAIERGWSYDTIDLLLECKADLFSRNPYNNQTPLWSLSARETDDTLRGEEAKPLMELAWLLISRGAWSDLMALNTLGETLAEKLHGDLSKFIQLCTLRCLHFIDECVSLDLPKQHSLPPSVSHLIASYLFDVHPYARYPLANSGLHSEEQKEQYQLELLLGDDEEQEPQDPDEDSLAFASPLSSSPMSSSPLPTKNPLMSKSHSQTSQSSQSSMISQMSQASSVSRASTLSPPGHRGISSGHPKSSKSTQPSSSSSPSSSPSSASSPSSSNMTCLRRMQLCRFSVECMEQDRIDDYLRALWFQTVYGSTRSYDSLDF